MVALLRSKIYPKYSDRKYYKDRVMVGKREKIEQIAARSNLICIFESSDLYNTYYNKVVPDWGIPNFIYTNDANRQRQFNDDRINYFAIESEVAIRGEEKVTVGEIIDNTLLLSKNMIKVRERGSKDSILIPVDRLKRIL
jgi:hypothetical protein